MMREVCYFQEELLGREHQEGLLLKALKYEVEAGMEAGGPFILAGK